MSFSAFNFNAQIAAALQENHFTVPTPIQRKAIPIVMAGEDLIGLAQTGTGKTAAFVLPILHRLATRRSASVRALILTPTRELAQQIDEVVRAFGRRLKLKSLTVFGGVSYQNQAERLKTGVDIVIGCPGRVLDHIQRRSLNLSELEVLVLDEADRMFDMGFLPGLRRIIKALPAERQNLLFSATMPADIKRLAEDILKLPRTVQAGSIAPVSTVSHAMYPVSQDRKADLLLKILDGLNSGSVLVFTRTKHRAKRIAALLEKENFSATSLQGNLSQARRDAAIKGFRSGRYRIMVATDIAARGLDISSISHVINFDMPDTVEAYTHRIGRTGRAERSGDALTFLSPEDRAMLRSIEGVLGAAIARKSVEGFEHRKPTAGANPGEVDAALGSDFPLSGDRANSGRRGERQNVRKGDSMKNRFHGRRRFRPPFKSDHARGRRNAKRFAEV